MPLSPALLFQLEEVIQDCLRNFHDRRMRKLGRLKLAELTSKNPYLYRALGICTPSELIKRLLDAHLSSSDETIFGDAFFEPVVRFIASGGIATETGMDVVIETDTTYTVIEVKSSSNWQNARMGRGFKADVDNAYTRFPQDSQKEFRAILGQSTGRKRSDTRTEDGRIFSVRSGQEFWGEITGEPDFYLTIMTLMGNYPQTYSRKYHHTLNLTIARLENEFIERFCNSDKTINWERLCEAGSGTNPPGKRRRRSKKHNIEELPLFP